MCHRRRPDYSGNSYLALHLSTERFRGLILDSKLKVTHVSQVRYDVDLPEFGTSHGTVRDAGPMEFLSSPVMWVKALDMLLNSLANQGADLHSIVSIGGLPSNMGASSGRRWACDGCAT